MKTAPKIKTEAEVMFFDTDCGGVVSNIAYLRFVETARTALTAELGLALRDMMESGLFPAVARTEIDYRKPAKLGDRLIVTGEILKFERVRIHCGFEIRREADDALITSAKQAVVLVQMPGGRPQRIPEMWLEAWPQLAGDPKKRHEK